MVAVVIPGGNISSVWVNSGVAGSEPSVRRSFSYSFGCGYSAGFWEKREGAKKES
jgi:hypothetical protein